jgi:hypothetical protein
MLLELLSAWTLSIPKMGTFKAASIAAARSAVGCSPTTSETAAAQWVTVLDS